MHFHRGYSDELAHWIEAASDLFLMPSRYEPCGLNQMYSLRYGTVPVVRRTGGLADSVAAVRSATGSGTGVLFNDFTSAPAHQWALNTALAAVRATSRLWRAWCRMAWRRTSRGIGRWSSTSSYTSASLTCRLNAPLCSNGIERTSPCASEIFPVSR